MTKRLLTAFAFAVIGSTLAHAQTANVLQDCWTGRDPDLPEQELYTFAAGDPVTFIWKHKITDPCVNYAARLIGFQCIDGKPRPSGIQWQFSAQLGEILPDPDVPERLLSTVAPPGLIPPGRWDWILLAECNDLAGNGIPVGQDGDIDDECGLNVGRLPVTNGPVIFGPEPVEVFDAHPGGIPPGRGPGESGTTRPWCFQVQGGPLPDLTVNLVNPPTTVSCPGGQGTCVHDVDFEISELNGNAVAGAFQVEVTTDNGLATSLNVPGIGAGATLGFTVTLGPGNNCYNPNCEVTVKVDTTDVIVERDENNNSDVRLDLG